MTILSQHAGTLDKLCSKIAMLGWVCTVNGGGGRLKWPVKRDFKITLCNIYLLFSHRITSQSTTVYRTSESAHLPSRVQAWEMFLPFCDLNLHAYAVVKFLMFDFFFSDMNVQNRAIMSLPLFLPTGKIDATSKKYRRATIKEAMDSFVDVQPVSLHLLLFIYILTLEVACMLALRMQVATRIINFCFLCNLKKYTSASYVKVYIFRKEISLIHIHVYKLQFGVKWSIFEKIGKTKKKWPNIFEPPKHFRWN